MSTETVPASYLVPIKDKKILLLKRSNTGYMDGMYSFIAGHVEPGESFTQCMIREAREESGISIREEDLQVVHVMHRQSNQAEANQRVDVFFSTDKWQGEIKNTEPEKCSDLSWFDLENLPDNIIPYIRKVIDRIQKSVFYSEDGWIV
jgi:ADP-ribose pyrophosphatase YjhB (NUDIX family)